MRRIGSDQSEPLHSVAATRHLERELAAALPPFEMMARAGASTASLARAIAPHARRIWIAAGPGNNGGDGLVAARHLLASSRQCPGRVEVVVTLCADGPSRLPADAARAWSEALAAGLSITQGPPDAADLVIDALLGIGAHKAPSGIMAEHLQHMHALGCPVLAVDTPSGLLADTGDYLGPAPHRPTAPRHTLSLLTLKPGLFTATGRDLTGTVWFDPLHERDPESHPSTATLLGRDAFRPSHRLQAAHKGTQGDVVVVGGQDLGYLGAGMTGAAILAARAALYAGAGRVYVGLLADSDNAVRWDPVCPELMFRRTALMFQDATLMANASVVCGCGGGKAVAEVLPVLLETCGSLVLDADALNHLAENVVLRDMLRRRQHSQLHTVLTPHPLEAARLLGTSTQEVMSDRLGAAKTLSASTGAITVLKGSGTVIAPPTGSPFVNSSGNPALATAGTGDVLAGWIGANLAQAKGRGIKPLDAVLQAVFAHGQAADQWVTGNGETLTANRLATSATIR